MAGRYPRSGIQPVSTETAVSTVVASGLLTPRRTPWLRRRWLRARFTGKALVSKQSVSGRFPRKHRLSLQQAVTPAVTAEHHLILWATEIKVRAERRAGEMLSGMEKCKGGDPSRLSHDVMGVDRPPTLSEMGIHRNESSRWQALAAMPEEHFETAVATAKESAGQVTTAFMLREAAKHKPQAKAAFGTRLAHLVTRGRLPASYHGLRW